MPRSEAPQAPASSATVSLPAAIAVNRSSSMAPFSAAVRTWAPNASINSAETAPHPGATS